MSRALVTLAVGEHEGLLAISLPSLEAFADRHGYEIVIADVESTRPPSWRKIPALLGALDEYDEALWVDADVVIVDPSDDIPIGDRDWHALARHYTLGGEVPNCGVWYVRQDMRRTLDAVWRMTKYLNHPWWEQAAVIELLGYGEWPLVHATATDLYRRTCFLDPGWNVHKDNREVSDHLRFMHATMFPDRAAVMRAWAAGAAIRDKIEEAVA